MNRLSLLLVLCSVTVFPAFSQRYSLSGTVRDRENRRPVELTTVVAIETAQGGVSDEKGNFFIGKLPAGKYVLRISSLGYETKDTAVVITKNTILSLLINKTSLRLKEVNVMALEKKGVASTSVITRSAIDHLQPSSLSDVMQLVPGGLLTDPDLSVANQVSSRQAGTDATTALGTAIVVDGVPLTNDNNAQSFYGASAGSDISEDKNTVNGGVDLRQISTDHIDEIEVIRGIPSVKYGDLTSGAIIVKSKKGVTPLSIRVKSDPLNKLFYVGRGFSLPANAGVLNIGVDFTNFVSDQRSPFDKYKRITSQINHEKRFGTNFRLSTQLSYTGTIDEQVYDPDVMTEEESYKSNYNGFRLSNSGTWNLQQGMLNKIEYTVSLNYAHDLLKRKKVVTLNSPMGISLSDEEGENEGTYLESEYLSSFKVDGKPFSFYSQVTTVLNPQIGKTKNNVLLGAEFRAEKNYGEGGIYDLTTPPFPTQSSSSRPRAPKSIPALEKLTTFAEDNFRTDIGQTKLKIVAGVRLSSLLNVSSDYSLSGKLYAEPRANAILTLPEIQMGNSDLHINLKAGFGDQVKFPTLMQLYPEKAYYDISELNYYSTSNTDNRLVYLLTVIKNRTNYDLKPARNRKKEFGFDAKYKGVMLDVTFFTEKSNNSFKSQSVYFPQAYKNYDNSSYTGTSKPSVSDFTYTTDTMFLQYSYATNGAIVNKSGIEYQLTIPSLPVIQTEIVLNGAWFKSRYDMSQPRYEYPTIVTNGKYYQYVGVYSTGSDCVTREQFNTNVFFNTHLRKQRLIFSTSLQAVWYTSYQMKEYSGRPDYYINAKGETLPFTDVEAENSDFSSLIKTFSSAYFNKEKTPVSLEVNLKASKEIGDHLQLSFFVNRLLDYNPKYTTRFGVETRNSVDPAFMGAEVQFKF